MAGLNLFAGAGAQQTAPLWGMAVGDAAAAAAAVAAPAPTARPPFYRNALGIRQDSSAAAETTVAFTETCAWFSHTVSSLADWEALPCDEPCTTSGSLFGCNVIPTTCNDLAAPVCQSTATEAAICCDATFPYCITGILEEAGNTFTAFRCGNEALSGEMPLYADTSVTRTSVVTEGDEKTTVTVIHTPTEPADDEEDGNSDDDTSNPGDQDNQSSDNEGSSSGGGGGGGAPVGAIVGGVIGGVALIVAIGFAIWFIRFQKKKAANKPSAAGMEPYRYDQSAAYAGAGGHPQQGAYDYSQGGYNGSQYGMAPAPFSQAGGSPKPGEMQQMGHPGMSGPPQAPVEMPGYSNYGAPSELPSDATSAGGTRWS